MNHLWPVLFPPLIDYELTLKIFKWHIQKNSFRKISLFPEQWLTGAVSSLSPCIMSHVED